MPIHALLEALAELIRIEKDAWSDREVTLKALKPNEDIPSGHNSLIRGESCNTWKQCAGHHCPLGQGRGATVHQWLCELLSGALMSVAPFPKLSAVVYSTAA